MGFDRDAPRCFFLLFHSADLVFLIKKSKGTAGRRSICTPLPHDAPQLLCRSVFPLFVQSQSRVPVSGREQPAGTGHSVISLVGLNRRLANS